MILKAYNAAEKRLLFLDYDGTLVPFSDLPEEARLGAEARRIIVNLSSDMRNCIFIISGRPKEFLNEQFHGMNVGLVAEHGFLIKAANGEWMSTSPVGMAWKDSIRSILQEFIIQFPGSVIEEKEVSIAYHYRILGREVGRKLRSTIRKLTSQFHLQFPDLEVLAGNNVLEVKPKCYNKGLAASAILRTGNFDFILAAGDDVTDEQLFTVVDSVGFTIKIGRSPTIARNRVNSQEHFIDFLKELIQLR
jgi:trehalose 6-phosphate synthase/phosphatase